MKRKDSVSNCKCVCEPPKKRKRRAPVYSRPPPPQFYLSGLPPAVPVPTIADTVRLAVRDEFDRRHHLPMPNREPFYAKPSPITMTQDLKGLLASSDVPMAVQKDDDESIVTTASLTDAARADMMEGRERYYEPRGRITPPPSTTFVETASIEPRIPSSRPSDFLQHMEALKSELATRRTSQV